MGRPPAHTAARPPARLWLPLRVHLAGVALSLLGLVLLTHPPFLFGGHTDWDHARVLGTCLGLASAFLAAGAFISIRFIGEGRHRCRRNEWDVQVRREHTCAHMPLTGWQPSCRASIWR